MEQLWDAHRRQWVAAQPEELVRQRLVDYMVNQLGFPQSLIVVEKAIHHLPHLAGSSEKLPSRRVDIICFARDLHPQHSLYPLLLVECKAIPLNARTEQQVVGYNHYVGAYYLAIANESEIRTACYQRGSYEFVPGLPRYEQLLALLGDDLLRLG